MTECTKAQRIGIEPYSSPELNIMTSRIASQGCRPWLLVRSPDRPMDRRVDENAAVGWYRCAMRYAIQRRGRIPRWHVVKRSFSFALTTHCLKFPVIPKHFRLTAPLLNPDFPKAPIEGQI